MERARLELLAANEIGLVRIDTERVTIGVDPRRGKRQQVSTSRERPTGGNNQISHLACFGIHHDAVEPPEIPVVIVPDREVSVCVERPADTFRVEIAEPGVRV